MASDLFENLGYKIAENTSEGFRYERRRDEVEQTGFLTVDYIEFYYRHKEIVTGQISKYRDYEATDSCAFLHKDEINAIQKQIEELKW